MMAQSTIITYSLIKGASYLLHLQPTVLLASWHPQTQSQWGPLASWSVVGMGWGCKMGDQRRLSLELKAPCLSPRGPQAPPKG